MHDADVRVAELGMLKAALCLRVKRLFKAYTDRVPFDCLW